MAEEAFEAKRAAYHQALHNQRSQWTDRKLSRKVPPKAEGQYLDIDRAQVRCHCMTVSSKYHCLLVGIVRVRLKIIGHLETMHGSDLPTVLIILLQHVCCCATPLFSCWRAHRSAFHA